MAERAWPLPNQPMPDGDWEALIAQAATDGVIGVPGGAPLKVTASGTAMSVSVAAGDAVIAARAYRNDAAKTITIPAPVNQNRVDRIVVDYDRSAGTITTIRLPGTEGSPAPSIAPTATHTYLPLARVTARVTATAIVDTDVAEERIHVGPAVRRVHSSYAPPGNPGDQIYTYDTNRLYVLNPTGTLYLETWGPHVWAALPLAAGFASGEALFGGRRPEYSLVADRLYLRGIVKPSSGNFAAGGNVVGTLPAGYRPNKVSFAAIAHQYTSGMTAGRCEVGTNGEVMVTVSSTAVGWAALDGMSLQLV